MKYSCERRISNRSARAQLPSWAVRVNARETIRTAPPSGWHQSRGYVRCRLKPPPPLQQSKTHVAKKTKKTPQRLGRAPMLGGAGANKKPKRKGNARPFTLTVARD